MPLLQHRKLMRKLGHLLSVFSHLLYQLLLELVVFLLVEKHLEVWPLHLSLVICFEGIVIHVGENLPYLLVPALQLLEDHSDMLRQIDNLDLVPPDNLRVRHGELMRWPSSIERWKELKVGLGIIQARTGIVLICPLGIE